MSHYPETPGWRPHSAPTSKEAALDVKPRAPAMLKRVEDYLREFGPASCEEITEGLTEPGERLLLTSVRARVCQLHKLGRLVDSGQRGLGESLRSKVVKWRITDETERAVFAARQALRDEKEGDANG